MTGFLWGLVVLSVLGLISFIWIIPKGWSMERSARRIDALPESQDKPAD
ncbi:MAG: hypothetical protein K6U87_12195 [Firmicutes bacterium]|jgi:hypothetical protein|nr:hypothetical protein [Bacillota bacterium]